MKWMSLGGHAKTKYAEGASRSSMFPMEFRGISDDINNYVVFS